MAFNELLSQIRNGRLAASLGRAFGWFPLTPLGILVLAGSTWALLDFGLERIDLVLLVVGAVGAGVGLIAVAATLVAALIARVRFGDLESLDPLEVECGFPVPTGFSLPRPWWLPLVSLRWTWVEPEAHVRIVHRRGRAFEEVVASRRGVVGSIVRRLEVGDVFGLSRMSFDLRERRRVRFVPSVGALKRVDVIRGMSGGDDLSHPDGPQEGELYDLRHYTPGDPIRFVLWKVFAKSRQLVIRAPERAISPVRQTVAYLVSGARDEPAAGAARLAVDHGALGGDWVLGADGSGRDATTKNEALEVLAQSGLSDGGSGGKGLSAFLRRTSPGVTGRAVVFVPGRPGPWLESTLSACGRRGEQIEFVICTDGIVPSRKQSWIDRLSKGDVDSSVHVPAGACIPCSTDEVGEVARRLSGGGSRVLVVDRLAGKVYGDGHVNGLLRRESAA